MGLPPDFYLHMAEREAAQAVKLLEAKKAWISNQLDIARANHARLRNQRVVTTSHLPYEIMGLIFVTAKQISRSPI